MRVAIVSDVIYGYISGLAIFAKRLIDQLSDKVEKVVVLTAGDKTWVEERGNITIYHFKGLTLKKFEKGAFGVFSLSSIKKILKEEKIDIVHCQFPSLMGARTVFHSKKLNVPVVFTSHIQPENVMKNFNLKSERVKSVIYRYITWLYNNCDHITCPSTHAETELLEYGLNHSRKTVISNGIDSTEFFPTYKTDPVILFVGRVMPEKCLDTLIRASVIVKEKYPEYKVVVGGSGYALDGLKKLAAEINPDVHFTNRLTDEELLEHFQRCYMFVLPSESELQGICLLEAMACGKPTIASDSPYSAARELANFMYKHNDHEDLAEKIIYLIENKEEAERLSRENRKIVETEHDYSKITGKFLALYENIIESKKSAVAL